MHGEPLALALPLSRLAAEGGAGAAIPVQRQSDGVTAAAAQVPLPPG